MSGYLIGGRFLSGLITIRQVIPRSASVELSLNEAESIDVGLTLPLVDPATGVAIDIPNQLLPGRDFLGWVEDGVVLASGQIQGDPFTFPGGSRIKAAGLGSYFDHRFVLPVLDEGQLPRDVTSKWSGLSLRTIAKRLVQQAISHPGADLPIDFEPDEAGTQEREYPGSDGMRVGQALENLTNVDGGPDITFRPKMAEDRRHVRWDMLTGSPQLTQGGADHYWDVSAPGPHAAVGSLVRDGRDLASRSFLTGATIRNMIPNSSVEDGTDGFTGGNLTVVQDSTWAAHGSMSALLRTPTNADCHLTIGGDVGGLRLGMQAGKSYVFSATGNVKEVLSGSTVSEPERERALVVHYRTDAGAYTILKSPQVPNVLGGNTRVSIAFTLPEGTTECFIRAYHGRTAGQIRWDAFMLHEGTEPAPFGVEDVQLQASADNTALLDEGFPLMESWENRSSVLRDATLQAYADESVVRYSAHTETFTLRVKRDRHPKLGTYWPGDWAKIRIGKNPRIPADTYRVRIVRISFQAEGDVTIECAPERVAGGYPVPASNRAWLTDQLRALNARVDETNRG